MAIGDQVRRIANEDMLVFDSSGNVIGIRSGKSSGQEGRMLSPDDWDSVQAMVAGGGITTVDNFAALLALESPTVGQLVRVSAPVIDGGVPYIQWVYTADGWRLAGRQILAFLTTPANATASTAEQVLFSLAFAPSVLLNFRQVSIQWVVSRSGTTDAFTTNRLRIGTAGTTADASFISTGVFPSAANRQSVFGANFLLDSATLLRHVLAPVLTGAVPGSQTTLGAPATQAITDVTAGVVYVSFSTQMAGTTDTAAIQNVAVYGD